MRSKGDSMSSEMPNPNDNFEEFTGKLLRKLGCRIEREPPVGNGFADFHATTSDNDEFYVEATVAGHRPFSNKPTEADVCDKLNAMCSNPYLYGFIAWAQGELYQKLPEHKLSPIKKWVEDLSTIELKPTSKTFAFPSGTPPKDTENASTNWVLKIMAEPRPEVNRGVPSPPMVGIGGGGAVDSAKPLLTAAKAKVKQHKCIARPLLLTLNDMGDIPSGPLDVALALFGWEQEAEEAGVGRIRITRTSGKRMRSLWGTGENSTISAILLFHELTPHTLPYAKVCLYENPQARYPITSWLRQFFPYAVVEEEQEIQYLSWHPGPRLSTALGIPPQSRPHAELERRSIEAAKGFLR